MAPAPTEYSFIVTKTVPWRDQTAFRTSNRYFMKKSADGDPSNWETLRAAVVNAEKLLYKSNVHIVEVKGTAPGSSVPVFDWTGSVAGTNGVSNDDAPGEMCALVRYFTDARTVKNHPVYLYNYFHGATVDSSNKQKLGAIAGLLATYAAAWISGFSDGTDTWHRCGPRGASALSAAVDPYLRIHTFPHGAFRV